jgi:hypothetical protein
MTASHSTGSLFEVSTVAAEWWRSTTSSYRSAVSVGSSAWRAKSSTYSELGITRIRALHLTGVVQVGSRRGQPSTCPQSEHTKSPGQRSPTR